MALASDRSTPETFRQSGCQPGVYTQAGSKLATSVLPSIDGLRSWSEWYQCPSGLGNGHVHTILASQLRKTANVCYVRTLLPTPDGGTLALDMLKSVLPEVSPTSFVLILLCSFAMSPRSEKIA